MPFLAPVLGAVAGPLAGALGGLFGGGAPQLTNAGNASQERQFDLADTQLGLAHNGAAAFQSPLDYWSSILKGGPQAMQALSPQIQQIQSSSQQAQRGLDQFGPRGGGRAQQLAQLPFQRQGQISNLYSNAMPQAAQQLGGLAGNMTGLGIQGLGSNLQNIMGNQLGLMGIGQQNGANLGGGLDSIFSSIPWGKIFGGGGGSGGGGGGAIPFGSSGYQP